METKLLPANESAIKLACELIKSGEVVGVPTETVYGLAGDATNNKVVEKIFAAKGRPSDNPLIVHIAKMEMLEGLVSTIPEDAKKLADAFWPGPLTIIMPKGKLVAENVTAGLDSVGIRMPSNKIARDIILRSGIPFAAPSANISGRPSPTTAADVYEDMNGKIPLIIDGGICDAGVESTVVSVLGDTPVLLRPGVITASDIEKVLNKKVTIAKAILEGARADEKVLSPGMKYKHYAPNADITIVDSNLEKFTEFVKNNTTENTFVLCFEGEQKLFNVPCVTYGKADDPMAQAHELFSALRKLDEVGAKIVYARSPKKDGVSLAVFNRLIRSAGFKIIEL